MTLNDIRGVINSDIINFIYFLSENNYEEATISLKTKQLKLFFEYLYNIKHNIFKEPFRTIKTISNKYEKIPNYLSYEEVKKLESVYDNSHNKYSIRNKANNMDNISDFGKLLLKDTEMINFADEKKFKAM